VGNMAAVAKPVADSELNARSAIILGIMLTSYDDPSPSASPTALLHSCENSPADPNWYVDSGATHHLTADMANLAVHSEYQGPDRVHMGNGTCLPIHSTGASLLCSHASSFALKNLLRVLGITKNLMSVSQLTFDNKSFLNSFLTLVFSRIFLPGNCGDK